MHVLEILLAYIVGAWFTISFISYFGKMLILYYFTTKTVYMKNLAEGGKDAVPLAWLSVFKDTVN